DIDGVNPQLQPAFSFLADWEVLLDRKVKKLLSRSARPVERAGRIPQSPLHRPHEGRRVEIGFASLADGATRTPLGVQQWNAGNDVRTDGAHVPAYSQAVIVAQEDYHRKAPLNAANTAQAPASQQGLHHARCVGKERAASAERQIIEEGGAES